MSFRDGHTLWAEYHLAKQRRATWMVIGLFVGILLGAFAFKDAGWSVLSGLILTVVIGIWKSLDVMRIERIIFPGGKR